MNSAVGLSCDVNTNDDFTSNVVLISFQEVEYPMDLNEVISIINNALSDDRIANKTIIIDMRFLKLIDLEKLCINSNSSNILFLKNGNLYKYDFVFKELNKMKLMVNDISKSDLSPLEMVTAVYDIVKNYKKYTYGVELVFVAFMLFKVSAIFKDSYSELFVPYYSVFEHSPQRDGWILF